MVGCDECYKWTHMSCNGYTTASDLPKDFFCFACRIKRMTRSEIVTAEREGEIQDVLESLRDLALFRRAIEVIWTESAPKSMQDFGERLGVDLRTATGINKRLLSEQFLVKTKAGESDSINLLASESQRRRRRKGEAQVVVNKCVLAYFRVNWSEVLIFVCG
jgi:hypothetical protein